MATVKPLKWSLWSNNTVKVLIHIMTLTWELTMRTHWNRNCTTRKMISTFQLQLPIHLYQHSSSTYIRSLYTCISIDMIYHDLCNLSRFFGQMFAADEQTIYIALCSGYIKVITSEVLQLPVSVSQMTHHLFTISSLPDSFTALTTLIGINGNYHG